MDIFPLPFTPRLRIESAHIPVVLSMLSCYFPAAPELVTQHVGVYIYIRAVKNNVLTVMMMMMMIIILLLFIYFSLTR